MSNPSSSAPSSSNKRRKALAQREPPSNRFLTRLTSEYYSRFSKSKITESKIIDQNKLNFPILDLFRQTSLFFLVTLHYFYNPEMLLEFLANFSLDYDTNTMKSYVCQTHVSFSEADLSNFLHLSNMGPKAHEILSNTNYKWNEVNMTLRKHRGIFHDPKTESLGVQAKVVQHVLRNAVLPKAGDRKNITPLLSLVTHFVLTKEEFNSADLIIRYFESRQKISDIENKKKYNIGLGHVVAYLLYSKYQITYPGEATHSSIPFTNNSFHIFYPRARNPPQQPQQQEEGEQEQEEAAPSWRSSVDASLQRIESSVNNLADQTQTRFDQLNIQMNHLMNYFQHPPPPPSGNDFM